MSQISIYLEMFSQFHHITILLTYNFSIAFVILQETRNMEYLVSFERNGKVIESVFCDTEDEIRVQCAIAHSKGCECEIFSLAERKSKETIDTEPEEEPKARDKKVRWEIPVKCVETGVIYNSVSDCSFKTGINRRALYNAILRGTPRKGFHFIHVDEKTVNRAVARTKKSKVFVGSSYICINTGELFNSITDVFQKYSFPITSFYRSIREGKEIKGLRFKKLERNSRLPSQANG